MWAGSVSLRTGAAANHLRSARVQRNSALSSSYAGPGVAWRARKAHSSATLGGLPLRRGGRRERARPHRPRSPLTPPVLQPRLDAHLRRLEAEAVEILREAAAGFERPVMLYSIGKDSGVLLHLLAKAFAPAPPPMPLLHVDTGWKFQDMYAHRDAVPSRYGARLLVHRNPDGVAAGVSPLTHGSAEHTRVMKTEALKQALDLHGFDAAVGGARRDEERSRAKERVFSVRGPGHSWDARRQRPEMWANWNTRLGPGETCRVFPLSNWTELDVWEYTRAEAIPVVPLYFAAPRPVVRREGRLIVRDDDRLQLGPGDAVETRRVRFRSLGCWPLSAAVESGAADLDAVIAELRASRASEREGRLIDADETASMERKKREGYF